MGKKQDFEVTIKLCRTHHSIRHNTMSLTYWCHTRTVVFSYPFVEFLICDVFVVVVSYRETEQSFFDWSHGCIAV